MRTRNRVDGQVGVAVHRVAGRRYLQLRYRDPETGRTVQVSSQSTQRRDAEREAGRLAEKIEADLIDREVGWERE